ncbi:MAG: glycosyltransferase family 39 protein [candidate division Zixibacteria bacterium]|nr:glycosyltransferase family 39 protein [candidate division Zixibacteria bacterium]
MLNLLKKNPLWICLLLALILRLFSVIYSRGYMASDDHFETVQVAYEGARSGLLNPDGLMRWNAVESSEIGRSPLYVLLLYSLMKIQIGLGIQHLNSQMYLIRLIHALLSLSVVWFGYRYIYESTGQKKYSLWAGLILAAHFLMPYLSVRNLIEQVSADILVPAVFLAYMGAGKNNGRLLMLSGILGGLSWMIRFNTGLAIMPIPFVIWYLSKNVRPALYFCAGVLLMIIFSGSLDAIFLGSFGRSTLNILKSVFFPAGAPPLPQPIWIYTILIFGVLIPPFSLYFLLPFFRRAVIRKHLILFSAVTFFFAVHCLISHKEERFLIPIFPLIIMMGVIGLRDWLSRYEISNLHQKVFKVSAIAAILLNFLLLPLFTFNYGHKGLVEPLAYLSHQEDIKGVFLDQVERNKLIPYSYVGFNSPPPMKIYDWPSLERFAQFPDTFNNINYIIVFGDRTPKCHTDSLSRYMGSLKQVFHSSPSFVEELLHLLNPGHNLTNESWVFRRN